MEVNTLRKDNRVKLTMGPILFNWDPEIWRDFYYRLADEAEVDTVCLGDVICSKRAPQFAPHTPAVVERLLTAGKEVVLSSLALIMSPRELNQMRELVAQAECPIEANDISLGALLEGRAHNIGPFVNVYNEGTLSFLAARGATRICLPTELPALAVRTLQNFAVVLDTELEVMVFGRLPLAISSRCYHARSAGLHKDNCRFVCGRDGDGLQVNTLEREPFLAINGPQTLSASYLNLAAEVPTLQAMGIGRFRLSPHTMDMVAVVAVFRALTDGVIDGKEAEERLAAISGSVPICNGYFHNKSGCYHGVVAGV